MPSNPPNINDLLRSGAIFRPSAQAPSQELWPANSIALDSPHNGFVPYNEGIKLGPYLIPQGGMWVGPTSANTPINNSAIITDLPVIPYSGIPRPEDAAQMRASYFMSSPQSRGQWLAWLAAGSPSPELYPYYSAMHTRMLFEYLRSNHSSPEEADAIMEHIRGYAKHPNQLNTVYNYLDKLERGLPIRWILLNNERLLSWRPNLKESNDPTGFISAAQIGLRMDCYASIPYETVLHFLLHEHEHSRTPIIPNNILFLLRQHWDYHIERLMVDFAQEFGTDIRIEGNSRSRLSIPQNYIQIGIPPSITMNGNGWWRDPWQTNWHTYSNFIQRKIQQYARERTAISRNGLIELPQNMLEKNAEYIKLMDILSHQPILTTQELIGMVFLNNKDTPKRRKDSIAFIQKHGYIYWQDRDSGSNIGIIVPCDDTLTITLLNAAAVTSYTGYNGETLDPTGHLAHIVAQSPVLTNAKIKSLTQRDGFAWEHIAHAARNDPNYIATAEKLFKYGPGSDALHSMMHRTNTHAAHTPTPVSAGLIDMDRLRNLQAETQQSAELLHAHLDEAENTDAHTPPSVTTSTTNTTIPTTPTVKPSNDSSSLTPVQSFIATLKIHGDYISNEQLYDIIGPLSITQEGAIDAVNDLAAEHGGDTALIENDDGYDIDQDMLNAIPQ